QASSRHVAAHRTVTRSTFPNPVRAVSEPVALGRALMLFDTTFLIDLEREIKRNRPGPANFFLTKNPTPPLHTSVIGGGKFAEGSNPGGKRDCGFCLHRY